MDEQTERYMTLCKGIWDHINQEELKQIKLYLRMMGEPKFGKAQLEKVENGVDLLPILQERELLGINNLSFIKTLLKYLKRDDLLKEVNNYEKEPVKAADAKPIRPKSDPTYASSDSRCEIRHLQQSIDTKKHEIEHEVQYQSDLSTELKKLKDDMEEQTEIISNNEMKLATIDLGKKQKQENERKYRDEAEQIEAKISQLQKEKRETLDLARSLHDDIDRMSQEHRDVQYLISQSKDKKNEISKQYTDKSGKKSECSQTINNFQLEIYKLELQINRRSENLKYQPIYRPNSNKKDLHSEAFSDVTTDAQPTERANTINKEYRTQHDPIGNVVIIISAEENVDQSSSFQDDLKEIQGEGTLICDSIVVRGQLTEEFLNVTNDKIPQAKLVFMLFSQAFVKNCWPEICKMKNFNSAIYDNKPLIVPVSAEQNTKFPMGMKSAHNLSFHRRDAYYKAALKKLVRPYIM